MVNVEYKRANIHGIGAIVDKKNVRVRLTPGSNTLENNVWDACKKHPLVKAMIEEGIIVEKSKGESFMNISSKEAIEIVNNTNDVNKLHELMGKTRTKSVKKAIEDRIAEIEAE